MKTLVLVIILAITTVGFAQQPCNKGRLGKTVQDQFESDLKDNSLKLYVMGGIAAVITTEDREVASKYNFSFHDFGCLAPDISYYKSYNSYMVSYLNKKYGNEWQKDIRKNLNIIGRDSLLLAEK